MGTHCPRWANAAQRVDETSRSSLLVLDEPAALPTRSTKATSILVGLLHPYKEADSLWSRRAAVTSRVDGAASPELLARIQPTMP